MAVLWKPEGNCQLWATEFDDLFPGSTVPLKPSLGVGLLLLSLNCSVDKSVSMPESSCTRNVSPSQRLLSGDILLISFMTQANISLHSLLCPAQSPPVTEAAS